MDATTDTRVKALLDISGTSEDAVLGQLITTISARIEDYIDRPLETLARTEEYDIKPRQRVIFLRAYPLSAQADVASIKVSTTWDFAATSALATTSYHTDLNTGAIHLTTYPITNYLGNNMATAPNAVQVTYTGGLGAAPANIIADYPAIAGACETQVIAAWRRRDEPMGKTTKIGEYAATVDGPLQFLPDVIEALMPYRRMRFGQ